MSNKALALRAAVACSLAACRAQRRANRNSRTPHREVAPIVGGSFSTEDARDRLGEAEEVMQLAGVKPGMSVADIGAGEGYYTVRLARVVGAKGRVLAEDIVPEMRDTLSERVQRESLDNVAVKLGTPDDPDASAGSRSTACSWSTCIMRWQSPYAFLWHLREGVKPDGRVVVVDADRPVKRHGIPPRAARVRVRRARPGAGQVQRR